MTLLYFHQSFNVQEKERCTHSVQTEAVFVQGFHGELYSGHLREACGAYCCRTSGTMDLRIQNHITLNKN